MSYGSATGGILSHRRESASQSLGIAFAAAIGLGAGFMVGLISGGLFGRVNSDRFRQVVSRLRPSERAESEDLDQLEHDLLTTLRSNPTTRRLDLGVRALGGGMVELTGNVPEEATRELAGRLARGVPGADVVVNRILVDGRDTADDEQGPASQVT
jgi:hypothetical protein